MDPEKKTCEFGIILRDDSVKDRGIGTEAIRIGMKLARDRYGMISIIGDTMGRNKRMARVFEKLGFTLTETVPGAFELPDGTREPIYDDAPFVGDAGVMFSGMTAKSGWEWFNPVRGEDWFREAVDRAKKLLEE